MRIALGRLACSALAMTIVAGCSDGGIPANTGSLTVAVAPLSLPGVTNAEYTILVSNGTETVFTVDIDSQSFGDANGSASYVGPCDAEFATNDVSLTLTALYDVNGLIEPATYQNPGTLTKAAACDPNEDTQVDFDIAILRQANQGFFDIAVSFDNIFCSAKLDCVDEDDGPLNLLHSAGTRDTTVVVGLACTGGPGGSDTTLYRDDLVISCDGGANITTVDPSAGPGNIGDGTGISGASGVLFGAAIYRGTESLGLNKRYWNVALGVEDTATDCVLTSTATATSGTFDALTTPADTTWPLVDWNVTLTDAGGAVTCTRHPVNGTGVNAGVGTVYTAPGTPRTFSYAYPEELPDLGLSGDLTTADPGRWADGSYATTCDGYLNPVDGHTYTGPATGDGVYEVDLDGGDPSNRLPVYCDMTTDDGGWMLISKAISTTFDHFSSSDINLGALTDLTFTQGGTMGDAKRALAGNLYRFTCGAFTQWAYAVDPTASMDVNWAGSTIMRWSTTYSALVGDYTIDSVADCGACGGPATDLIRGFGRNWGRTAAGGIEPGCGLFVTNYNSDGLWWVR